jgi:RNA polymerase sigma-70 factor (ECF subfamily)
VLAELYEAYFGDLAAFAFRFVRDRATAQDVVHDVFLSLWSIHATIDVRTTLDAYLFGAVANRARNVVAQMQRDNLRFVSLPDDSDGALGEVSRDTGSPYESLESTEVLRLVMAAVGKLPERQRLALTLRLSKDMTYDEIGTVLGITKGSVAELLRKAQAHLRHMLGPLLP